MSEPTTVHVRANVNTLGLNPDQEAEIELTKRVASAIELGLLTMLEEDVADEPVVEEEEVVVDDDA